ncbi:MAG: glycosyltransferase family 92 protein [Chlamydiales bacterium]|nr:glycosyltransferase family 92 protein [Chlamydiales bacterium]
MTYRADDNYVEHRNTKCLYRPEAVDICLIHNAYLNKGSYQSRDVPYSVCRVNHYFTGTEKRLIEKRKLPKEGFDDLQEKLNVVEDRSLIEFKLQIR